MAHERSSSGCKTLLPRMLAAVGAILCVGALSAGPAHAAFEQVGTFAGSATPVKPPFEEEVQLSGAGGMAVNYTGAGGVPEGTVYAATYAAPAHVAMYEPQSDGTMKFVMGWEVKIAEAAYERCGPPGELPDGETDHPQCDVLSQVGSPGNVDVAVDQTTGNVFFQFVVGSAPAGSKAIVVFPPDGGEVITRFGEIAANNKTTAETPSQIHEGRYPGGLAVNAAGEVYVADMNIGGGRYHRLMKFKPTVPGVYDEYEYAGTSEDVAAGFPGTQPEPTEPEIDAAGHLYVRSAEKNVIEMYDSSNPAAPSTCQFEFKPGGIEGFTVDPVGESVFFFAYTTKPKFVHELGPCDEATGIFPEAGKFEVKPERNDLSAFTFDPLRKYAPTTNPGVLYGAAPGPVPDLAGKGEPGQSSLGYIFAPIEEKPPVIQTESVSNVGAHSAILHAVINPEGYETHYRFRYMTAAAYDEGGQTFEGASEAPAAGGEVGEGKNDVAVAVTPVALRENTEYRYQIVATSKCSPGTPAKTCETAGVVRTFRTYPPVLAGLSDHRVYELVSPAQKHGGQVFPANPVVSSCSKVCKPGQGIGRFPMLSTSNGESVAYEGSAFDPQGGASNENQYVARRTSTGWTNVNPTPVLLQSRSQNTGYQAFDAELTSSVLVQPFPGGISPDAPSEFTDIYVQQVSNPFAPRPLVVTQPPDRTPSAAGNEFVVQFAGASQDLSRVFFSANDSLTVATPVAPAASDGGFKRANLYEWRRSTGEVRLVNVLPGNLAAEPGAEFGPGSANAVSNDGRRAFWSDESGQVYVREDAEKTIEIPAQGKFLAAATNGSKVLLNNGTLYDLDAKETTDLTDGKGGFQGIAGQSDDLSHIYFVATAVLSTDENSHGAKPQESQPNLYDWSEGTTHFVATLQPGDNETISGVFGFRKDWDRLPSERTAKASPQGRYLAFVSAASLTGYDNIGAPGERCGPNPCTEVYLYDSVDERLDCPSCNPSNAAPLGLSQLPVIEGPSSFPQPSYLADSGRLYFNSQDSLSQSDTNEGTEDVYQWEPTGTNTCMQTAGCLALISAGRDNVDSNFLAADSDGANVFFTTRDRLVAADADELIDLYDAREFGGFPESVLAPSQCHGEACQAAQLAPPEPPPASSAVTGQRNGEHPKCKKGQVRKDGKCVKKPHHKKHKQKKARHKKSKAKKSGRAAGQSQGGNR